jgi:diguanylate cyclase (GGDEF)-like protein
MLNEVVLICSYKSFNVLLREAYHKLYEIYRELDLTREALSNLEKYISINDKIYDYEQNQLMVKMNLKNTEREADLYRKLYDKTELLSSIGQKIISNLDIDHIIQIIKKEINSLMSLDYFGIAVYDNQNKEAVYHFVNTMNGEKKVLPFKFDNNDTFGAYCINKKKDIIIGDIEKEYKYYLDSYPINIDGSKMIQSAIYTPLCIQDKVVGLMTVQSLNVDSYDKNDLNTLKIVANYTAIAVDNAMSYKKVENIAIYDNMTGFLTKSEIIRLGNIMYENYKSNKESFCVMMLDVDNFKNINDTYGHLLGDKAMVMLSEAISGSIRNTDYIGRYGGDEFLLICPGASLDEAKDVAERIRKAVFSKDFILGTDISVKITISIGVYELGKDDDSFIDGIRMADKYLYNAKNSLKNKVVCSLASFTI